MNDTATPELLQDYRTADLELRRRYSKIGCVLSLVLVPAGASLDYFVYPDAFWPLLAARVVCVAIIAVLFALHFFPAGGRHIGLLSLAWGLTVQGAIVWMIYRTEGAVSPYYAGLNLLLLGISVLLPFTVRDALLVWISTLALYLAACFLHGATRVEVRLLFNNLYFLTLTGIICLTSSYYLSRRRFEDFRLRHELDTRNQELARSYEQLAELDRLKSEFFANVSHEFRTPLTLILSPLQHLMSEQRVADPELARVLRVIHDNALRLLKLINDLLEVVRLEEGRTRLHLAPLDLAAFVPAIAESVRHLAEDEGLRLVLDGRADALVVSADARRLEKVLLNLLINSIKFTPAPGTVRVTWGSSDQGAVVEVEDTGIGIAPKDLPHVFDRFRQADSSSTRRYQGSGIGLALARELVEEHGGRLEAFSTLGKGTTLRMTLPPAAVPLPAAGPSADRDAEDPLAAIHRAADHFVGPGRGEAQPPAEATGRGEHTLLVVEDEPALRQFLVTTLAEHYRVLQAADGAAGLRLLLEQKPHLVLLDLMLPGMDGLAVCEAVKADPDTRGVKVVLLTARTDEEAKLAALDKGADDFLLKPFSTAEVRTRLANLLRAATLEEQLRRRNVELETTLARLQEAEAQLVQTEKMNALGNLAAGLLHEINNPLNYTLTALQLADASVPAEDPELREILDDIGEGMERIRDIVTDLRSFAYPDADNLQQQVSLAACLDTAVRLCGRQLDGVSLERAVDAGCAFRGSQTLVTHLLINLLTNAAQAVRQTREQRPPTIRVAARAVEGRVQVAVWDNGAGIPAENLERVFDPFFTTREVGEGMGLGLSICHTIVRKHGGTITARSEPGAWTEMQIELPLFA